MSAINVRSMIARRANAGLRASSPHDPSDATRRVRDRSPAWRRLWRTSAASRAAPGAANISHAGHRAFAEFFL